MSEKTEKEKEFENKASHLELVDQVIKNFPIKNQSRFCMKWNLVVHISSLKKEKYGCWKCHYYIINTGGMCDPI